MFCHQCQETALNAGCTKKQGVCGKTADVADLQDLFIWVLKGISVWGRKAKEVGITDLFATITNANFSRPAFIEYIMTGVNKRNRLMEQVLSAWKDRKDKPFEGHFSLFGARLSTTDRCCSPPIASCPPSLTTRNGSSPRAR